MIINNEKKKTPAFPVQLQFHLHKPLNVCVEITHYFTVKVIDMRTVRKSIYETDQYTQWYGMVWYGIYFPYQIRNYVIYKWLNLPHSASTNKVLMFSRGVQFTSKNIYKY